jgi:hypothetical protein
MRGIDLSEDGVYWYWDWAHWGRTYEGVRVLSFAAQLAISEIFPRTIKCLNVD